MLPAAYYTTIRNWIHYQISKIMNLGVREESTEVFYESGNDYIIISVVCSHYVCVGEDSAGSDIDDCMCGAGRYRGAGLERLLFQDFIDSNVILFVAMFIVGGALFETGMANRIGGSGNSILQNLSGS